MITRRHILTLALGASALIAAQGAAVSLSQAQLQRVGLRIWQNECAGSVAGLTSWNAGEDFASLGIGHFIWYPKGRRGPFEESFPQLVAFAESRGLKMPAWTKGPCPWSSKAAFEAESGGGRQKELRVILSKNVSLQTDFILVRLKAALPKMLAGAVGLAEKSVGFREKTWFSAKW